MMKKRLVAVLVAVVVGALVITGGVTLYGKRHQLFRPDADAAGGTEVVFEASKPAAEGDMQLACEVLRRRFDDDGRAGVEVDGQRFRPHVTVARTGRPTELTRWVRLLDAYSGPTWTVDRIALVESHLGEGPRRRPRYAVVEELALG